MKFSKSLIPDDFAIKFSRKQIFIPKIFFPLFKDFLIWEREREGEGGGGERENKCLPFTVSPTESPQKYLKKFSTLLEMNTACSSLSVQVKLLTNLL